MLMSRAGRREGATGIVGIPSEWLAIAGLCVLAFIVRCIGANGRPFEYDELYHILAGQSWAAGHGVSIAGGEYLRVRLYTVATGISMALFGDSPLAGRLPAIIAGAVQVGLIFAWVRAVAGQRAAWIAALLLCFGYRMIDTAQMARFYSWHVLAVWLFATQVYALATDWAAQRRGERAARIALALVALVIAVYVQATTVIAVIAIGAWAVPTMALSLGLNRWSRGLWIGAAAALVVLVLALTLARGLLLDGYHAFRYTAVWAEAASRRPTFYYSLLAGSYGWLIHLFPLAALLAYRRWPRPTLFCVVVVFVALLLHSLAGMKSDRYISYLDPFIVTVWALALDVILRPLGTLFGGPFRAMPGKRGPLLLACAAAAVAISSAAIGVPMYRQTLSELGRAVRGQMPFAIPDQLDDEDLDWTPYLATLRPLARTPMLVTADDLRALRYLGGYDLLLNRTVMWDFTHDEFGRDPRTGGPGITSVPSLAAVMNCYPAGTILVSIQRWRSPDVTNEVADFIERTAQPVALPAALRMRGFTWRGPDRRATPACQALEQRIGDRRHQIGERLVSLRP